jgi:hypothetical protein
MPDNDTVRQPTSPSPAAARRRFALAPLAGAAAFVLPSVVRAALPPRRWGTIWRAVRAARCISEGEAGPSLAVFFDARCPACALLYELTRAPLRQRRLRLAWLPVALLGAESLQAGARVLAAADPVRALALALRGGTRAFPTARSVAPRRADVEANSELLRWIAGPPAATPALLRAGGGGRPELALGLDSSPPGAWRFPP